MMFRSLFFIAPLVASDEQTAMLQLNRRGEVSQHSFNDALIGSLEHSLMSKDAEKPSETAACTYYLKTVHPTLLQKISALKGQEKTQLLLQRAMDSVGEQNLRNLEENLMSKDEDKKEDKKDEEPEKLSPCQTLHILRNTFKDHMHNEREVANKIKETGHKVGEMVEKVVKDSLDAALKVVKDGKPVTDAVKELKEINMTAQLEDIKKHRDDELKKTLEAIESAIPKFKGAMHKGNKMADVFNTSKTTLEAAVKDYEDAAITDVDSEIKTMLTQQKLPQGSFGYTQAEATKVFTDIMAAIGSSPPDEGKAKDALNTGIGYVKMYIDHVFEGQANNTWTAFANFWADTKVLGTDDSVKMATPPKDINDDLFWEQASSYLNHEKAFIEQPCHFSAFDKTKADKFAPRTICDGADYDCTDEFLYLAKKSGANVTTECDKVENTKLDNDIKVTDTKITNVFPFLKKSDGKSCEKWEKIKDACEDIKKR